MPSDQEHSPEHPPRWLLTREEFDSWIKLPPIRLPEGYVPSATGPADAEDTGGIYVDPCAPGRQRPDLVVELLGIPAVETHHQLENQASLILAWLADQSRRFGRALSHTYLGEHPCVSGDGAVGARSQISLPSPTGTSLRPDVSIDGPHSRFQILIEVKVAAEFASHAGVLQDDAYRASWRELTPHGPPDVRAVGTLTRSSVKASLPDIVDVGALRARDLSWSELSALIDSVGDQLEPHVAAVARSFQRAIARRLDVPELDTSRLDEFLAAMSPLIDAITGRLTSILSATATKGKAADFIGTTLRYLDAHGHPVVVRVIATPPGGVLTPVGAGPTLLIAVGRDPNVLLSGPDAAAAATAGFTRVKTTKFALTALVYPLPDIAEVASVADVVAAASDALRRAGLAPSPTPE